MISKVTLDVSKFAGDRKKFSRITNGPAWGLSRISRQVSSMLPFSEKGATLTPIQGSNNTLLRRLFEVGILSVNFQGEIPSSSVAASLRGIIYKQMFRMPGGISFELRIAKTDAINKNAHIVVKTLAEILKANPKATISGDNKTIADLLNKPEEIQTLEEEVEYRAMAGVWYGPDERVVISSEWVTSYDYHTENSKILLARMEKVERADVLEIIKAKNFTLYDLLSKNEFVQMSKEELMKLLEGKHS